MWSSPSWQLSKSIAGKTGWPHCMSVGQDSSTYCVVRIQSFLTAHYTVKRGFIEWFYVWPSCTYIPSSTTANSRHVDSDWPDSRSNKWPGCGSGVTERGNWDIDCFPDQFHNGEASCVAYKTGVQSRQMAASATKRICQSSLPKITRICLNMVVFCISYWGKVCPTNQRTSPWVFPTSIIFFPTNRTAWR